MFKELYNKSKNKKVSGFNILKIKENAELLKIKENNAYPIIVLMRREMHLNSQIQDL